MNNVVRFGLAAAAVLVAIFVGIQLFGGTNVGGPSPAETPSPTLQATASATPQATPSLTTADAVPPAGPLAIGRHSLIVEGVPFSLEVLAGWISNGEFGIDKDVGVTPEGAGFIFWTGGSPVGVFADPCAQVESPPAGPPAADLAAALTTIPGTDVVSGPSDVTVGGRPAKHVVLTVRDDIACEPEQFYLWYNEATGRYATALGSTIRVWIVDVGEARVWIDGETYKGASPEVEQELQQIVDSIQFE